MLAYESPQERMSYLIVMDTEMFKYEVVITAPRLTISFASPLTLLDIYFTPSFITCFLIVFLGSHALLISSRKVALCPGVILLRFLPLRTRLSDIREGLVQYR